MKSAIRNPKAEGDPISEIRLAPNRTNHLTKFGLRLSGFFRLSVLRSSDLRLPALAVVLLPLLPLALSSSAFPPAPHHTLYGMVRNQWGDPISLSPAKVFLETPSGVQLHAGISSGLGLDPGTNYRLEVPMDSGTAADLYQATALKPFFQFKLKVQIGQTTYLPIEMAGNFPQIGQPGQKSRLDLTLGVDTDGDGLPDAWEIANGLDPNNPNDGDGDKDGDGLSNRKEYLAGTYAFDPSDGFRLVLTSQTPTASQMEFLAIRGRTYSIQASSNLQQWTPVSFQVVTGSVSGALQSNYAATDVRTVNIKVPEQPGSTNRYFRATVQ